MRLHSQILSVENNDNLEKYFEKLTKFEWYINFYKISKKIKLETYDYLHKFISI